MRKITATGATALTAAAIAYTGLHAWLAFGLPARPLNAPSESCAVLKAGGDSEHYNYPFFNCLAHERDASVLKDYPGLASREGKTLTIFYSGKPIARLAPRNPDDTDPGKDPANAPCDNYSLVKAISVRDPVSARMEPLAVLTCHQDTSYARQLIGPAGKGIIVTDVAASPDGSIVAYGDNGFYRTSEEPGFVLQDWKTQKAVAALATCVYDTSWRLRPEPAMPFDARAWQDDNGQWHLQATRWLNPHRPLEYSLDGRSDFAPGFSLRWLPRFRSIAAE
jgi:antitoxin (DNA-binding transcriptional repressor) of toxin-antitoxin stability system